VTNTTLSIILFALIFLSAFFSAAETALMSVNRYRVRHLAKSSHRAAQLVCRLLARPDKLLSIILLGNTFATIMASAIAAVIAGSFFGEWGILVCSVILTLIMLMFAEVTPKTLAAIHPLPLSLFLVWPLVVIEKLFSPFVWVVNKSALGFLRVLGVREKSHHADALNADELRTLLHEAGDKIPPSNKEMLLAILDLGRATVEDVMISSEKIVGIDLNDNWERIYQQIIKSAHRYVPVFRDSLEKVQGFLNTQQAMRLMIRSHFKMKDLLKCCLPVYYIPESTLLSTQLAKFQKNKKQSAIVVDEYGVVVGLVTLNDILHEIVGEFNLDAIESAPQLINKQSDGTYIVEAQISLRELNRELDLQFSTESARTLSGAIIESLEMIPSEPMGLYLSGYPIEILSVNENRIHKVRIIPTLNEIA
jgi:Mg2+/Co2+ transporter CorB